MLLASAGVLGRLPRICSWPRKDKVRTGASLAELAVCGGGEMPLPPSPAATSCAEPMQSAPRNATALKRMCMVLDFW